MLDINVTFFIQLANFIIALFVVNILIIKPIREVVKKRRAMFAELASEAESVTQKSDARSESYAVSVDKARESGDALKNKLKLEGLDKEASIISGAQQEAMGYLQKSKAEIGAELESTRQVLRAQVGGMADRIVAKILA